MDKKSMSEALAPTVSDLRTFGKFCNTVADLLDRTTSRDVDGSNLSSMTAIRSLLDHPWMATSKARPTLNAAYKALWENAKANADAQLAAARAHLEAFAPPKRGRKAKATDAEPGTDLAEETTDIDATKIDGL